MQRVYTSQNNILCNMLLQPQQETSMKYDVVIPVIKKDFSKLPTMVAKVKSNMQAENIYIVSPTQVDNTDEIGDGVTYYLDDDVIPEMAKEKLGGGPWLYQQFFIKSFQEITHNEWYVAMDADLFVMREIEVSRDDTPLLFYAEDRTKIIERYGRFSKEILGVDYYPYTVMNEFALYNRDILSEFIEHVGGMEAFINTSAEIYSRTCFPAEAQLYLSWLSIARPSLYSIEEIKYCWRGMYNSHIFSEKDILDTLDKHGEDCDLYLIHSWIPAGIGGGKYTS